MFDPVFGEKLSEVLREKQKLSLYYKKLLLVVKKELDKEQISSIVEEELKHMSILKNIINKMFEGQINVENQIDLEKGMQIKLLEKIIYLEIKVIKTIKDILTSVQDIRIKNGLYYILADDQRHIDTIVFLYSKYT
ncbi:MAG: hypothetical protein ACM3KR_05435 [Deltaproteobacteria bacterium]